MWCGCRETATCERSPGPEFSDQLCFLCCHSFRSGAPAPLRSPGGGYTCRICLRSCPNVEVFHQVRTDDEMNRIVGESQSLLRFLS